MADIFLKSDLYRLLKGKFVLLLGDSNMSLVYNDVLYLLTYNTLITPTLLRGRSKKGWEPLFGDRVIRMSSYETAGRNYYKEREYKKDNIHLRFHFITKISGEEMNHTLNVIERKEIPYPDIIVVNSCMWDVTRWGPMREDDYKEDLIKFFSRIKKILPEDTLVIWTSTLPISTNFTKGGVLIKQLEFMKFSLRFMILEANKFTHQLCIAFGVDFLDLHYHMRFQLHRRSVDGIHWEPQSTRYITCLLLTHISLAFDVPLPGRVKGKYIQDCIDVAHNSKDIEPEWSLERGITLRLEEELSRLKIVKKPKLERESSKKCEEDKKETNNQLGNRVKKKANRRFVKIENHVGDLRETLSNSSDFRNNNNNQARSNNQPRNNNQTT
ncbi:UNVERIFIED_CONTAM: hypothetical protein RMT77_007278 [Armadillidium vulgare]